jgi:outer membrane receptor protein involved in Fe transport
MRLGFITAAVFLSIAQFAVADDAWAMLTKPTHIPAEPLSEALQTLAQERGFQVVYVSEQVNSKRTQGAAGDLTVAQALTQLLRGTNLTFQPVAENGMSILPLGSPSARSSPPAGAAPGGKNDSGKVWRSFSDSFRVAQGARGSAAQPGEMTATAGTAPAAQFPQLQEVVVTASKRAELLSRVPMAIQAVTGQQLGMLEAHTFEDYAQSLVGVQFVDGGTGRDEIFIRGVAAPQGYIGMESAVGVYLDDVPISEGSGQPDINLDDIKRVEVLRGPQGTLYGSASLGGTIRLITNRPKMNVVEGRVDAEFSGTDHGGFNPSYSAVLNLPLVQDTAAIRAVLYGRNPSGYIDNPVLGRKGVNSEDTYGGRVTLRVTPVHRLAIDLMALEQHTRQGAYNEADVVAGGQLRLIQYRAVPEPFLDSTQIYNMTAHYDADAFTVSSSTSFSRRARGISDDDSGFDFFGNGAITPSYQNYRAESLTQELRVSSVRTKPFSWLVGAYFDRTDDNFYQSLDSVGAAAAFDLPSDNVALLYQTVGIKQEALYGEFGYSPIEPLTVTVGLRTSRLELSSNSLRTGYLFGAVLANSDETTEDPVAPKLNVSYSVTPDALVYAQATKGYRIGGVNVTIEPAGDGFMFPKSYGPDSLWNYEVGFKGAALDRRLNFDADVFYIDWKDIQLDLQHAGYDYFANAGDAVSKGFEAQLTALATRNVQVGAEVTYTNARLSTTTPGVGMAGDRVPYVPQVSGSGFITITQDLPPGRLYEHVDVQHVGAAYTGFGESGNFRYGDYTFTNLKVGIDAGNWSASLFARNVFNKLAQLDARTSYAGVMGASAESITIARPRTVGVQISRSF